MRKSIAAPARSSHHLPWRICSNSPTRTIVAGSLVCPQCYSILLTLKVDEERH